MKGEYLLRDKLIELLLTPLPIMAGSSTIGEKRLSVAQAERMADIIMNNNGVLLPYPEGTMVSVVASQTSNNKNYYIFEDRISHYRIFKDYSMMVLDNHIGIPDDRWSMVFAGDNRKEMAEKLLEDINNVDQCV